MTPAQMERLIGAGMVLGQQAISEQLVSAYEERDQLRADLALEAGGDPPEPWERSGEQLWCDRGGLELEVVQQAPGRVEWAVYRHARPGREERVGVSTDDGVCTTIGEAMRHAVESADVTLEAPNE